MAMMSSSGIFLGPCSQVHGQADPRHQGGEGVAGTPGACSQVFCHPIRCMLRCGLSTEIFHILSGPHHNHHHHHHHHHHRMTVAMALAEFSDPFLEGTEDGQGRGVGARAELHGEDPEAPHTPAGALQPRRRARRASQHLCLRSLAGRTRWCGTSWKISAPSARSCRSSIFLCRRWWTSLRSS